MTRNDLLVSLIQAGADGDREKLCSVSEAMIADERAKRHFGVADRLQRALQRALSSTPKTQQTPMATSPHLFAAAPGCEAILEITPRLRLDDLSLSLPTRESGLQLIEEHRRADVLRANGYEPRHRVLLSGPPGNGKTSFAEAIAEGLGLPFYVVRYDTLIGSYLGETNARLRKLFDYVRTAPSVLFFDEFDAIGKERGDTHETGEIKRVVSFLLTLLDQLPSYVLMVAATNHGELLDRAVWRRFQMRLSMSAPKRDEIKVFLDRIISNWPDKPKMCLNELADCLRDVSYAEALDFCQNVRRRHILGMGKVSIDDALLHELQLWISRVTPEIVNAERSNEASCEADFQG